MSKLCLVVDDSSVVRKVVVKMLRSLGFDAIEAENGQKALDQIQEIQPAVILLDWNMPIMDGIEFLQHYRQQENSLGVKVIFCTAENDTSKIQCALDAGADEYIMKPFDEEIVRLKFQQIGLL
jgi:two-component system chemotaxis response regulator CheY